MNLSRQSSVCELIGDTSLSGYESWKIELGFAETGLIMLTGLKCRMYAPKSDHVHQDQQNIPVC